MEEKFKENENIMNDLPWNNNFKIYLELKTGKETYLDHLDECLLGYSHHFATCNSIYLFYPFSYILSL